MKRCALRSVLWGAAAIVGVGCTDHPVVATEPQPPDGWAPSVIVPSEPSAGVRGYLDVRGLIHAHSVYSHDACDGEPRVGDEDSGPINEPCFEDFRRDMCVVGHDFIMLTDHRTSFGRTEFPDVLLYRQDRGDELIEHEGVTTANQAACPDGPPVTILAGNEAATMPVGLEGHIDPDVSTRQDHYGQATPEVVQAYKDNGAVTLVAHTEDWTAEELIDLGLDGFEMYNIHANLISGVGLLLDLLPVLDQPEELPHPDLLIAPVVHEQESYLSTWSEVLAAGARRVTTMGTDCHRNAFADILEDGERVDSYRRMMKWFSNHLLVAPGWDDRDLKDALRAGRLYGSFDVFGYPSGFDYHAIVGGDVQEMGAEVSLADGVELHVSMPSVTDLGEEPEPPKLTARILRATSGGWEVVAEGEGDLDVTVDEPGAYRAEIRMEPRHLRFYLRKHADLAENDYPWVYANPIYVTP